ncbi:MAG: ABC transporter ATP-binding protein [Acutalibacteraceae bacterium]|nr:ABC transporter ATP-binding protein [Acutalibacteraceae bacterium]
MNLCTIENLSKHYPKFSLQNVSFSLAQGRIMGLIGKNGAGKSTVMKSILNLVFPDSGKIKLFGKDIKEHESACKQELGVVLGGINFYQMKKISEITAVTKRFYTNWDQVQYEKLLELFEIDPSKRVKQLSSGMKIKYSIALALSHHAKLLILDEPTSGLDPVSRDDLLELFQSIVKNSNRSILYSTHITTDLDKCADDICYIKNGTVLACADKTTFLQSFQHLKQPNEKEELSLEQIMIRTERQSYDDAMSL